MEKTQPAKASLQFHCGELKNTLQGGKAYTCLGWKMYSGQKCQDDGDVKKLLWQLLSCN